jgi:hypothetical protein
VPLNGWPTRTESFRTPETNLSGKPANLTPIQAGAQLAPPQPAEHRLRLGSGGDGWLTEVSGRIFGRQHPSFERFSDRRWVCSAAELRPRVEPGTHESIVVRSPPSTDERATFAFHSGCRSASPGGRSHSLAVGSGGGERTDANSAPGNGLGWRVLAGGRWPGGRGRWQQRCRISTPGSQGRHVGEGVDQQSELI